MGYTTGSWQDQLLGAQNRQTYETRVQGAVASATPQLAAGTVAMGQTYPWMEPQTAYALTANGNQPGDPLTKAVAVASINKKGGGFWHSLGQVVTAPLRSAVSLGETVIGDAQHVAKVGARIGLTAAETPFQVGMGALRDVAAVGGPILGGIASGAATGAAVGLIGGAETGPGALVTGAIGGIVGGVSGALAQAKGVDITSKDIENPFAQSTGGQAIGSLVTGHGVDLGSGFLPGGRVREAQVKAAQNTAAINGHALTPGRMLASGVFQPGSTGYNLLSGTADAITQWNLDPTRYVGEEVAAARAGAKVIPGTAGAAEIEAGPITNLFRRAGILQSPNPAVDTDKAREFFTTDTAARRFVTKAKESDSAAEIWAASNGKLPAAIANQLKATTDEQGVLDVLLNGVEGGELKYRDAVRSGRGALSVVPTFRPPARLAPVMDRLGGVLPEHSVDLQDLGTGADHKLDNAVTQMENFLKQARYSRADRNAVLDRLMATTTAQEARRVFTDTVHDDLRSRLLNLGMPEEAVQSVVRTGAEDRRLLLSQVNGEVGGNAVQQALSLGDGEVGLLNKPNELAEQQTYHFQLPDARGIKRMTTPSDKLRALYNSNAFLSTEHAADTFMGSWKKLNLARPALAMRMTSMGQAKLVANGLETDLSDPISLINMVLHRSARPSELEGLIEGSPLSQAEELMKVGRRMRPAVTDPTPFQQVLAPGDEGFARAWAARVGELHADPVARAVATDGYEQAAQSFWDGPLASEREELAVHQPELSTREGADAYIHGTIKSHIEGVTANNPDLVDSIGTGRLTGVDVLKAHPGGLVNKEFESALAKMVDDADIEVPNKMVGAKPHQVDPDYGNKVGRVTSWFYSHIVGGPMDALVNHPAGNQLYWKAVAENAGLLDEEGAAALRTRLAEGSDRIRMPDDIRARIDRSLAHPAAGTGSLAYGDVDKLSRAQAAQGLQNMTIDMAKKTGWQDSMRHMVPFAKHWQQETSQWARLLTDHPEAFRKGQMVVQGAQGSGFFHKNDQGQYVFNYPMSGLVNKVLGGTPFPLQAKAAGLAQMTTDIMPGAGPILSVAAAKLLPNTPQFDDLRNFLAPYGDPTAPGIEGAVLPPWAKTLKAALDKPDSADTANTTMQVARYLVSTGKFTMDTPENIERTLSEAGSRAKKLLGLQALGKFVLPSSPSLQPMAEDKDGRTVVAKLLSDDLQKMRTDDYENSTENFLSKYGDSALLFLQATTRPLRAGAADTKEQEDFLRENPDMAEKFPDLAAFFAPQGSQTFDPASTARQVAAGARERLTPDQQVALANKQVGSMIYYQAKATLGTRISAPQQALLDQLKGLLRDRYPGFDVPIVGLGTRLTDDPQSVEKVVIPEINRALQSDKIANSQTGRSVQQYLQVRDAVAAAAGQRGEKSWQTANKTSDLRQILRKAADIIGQNDQGFSMMFDELLGREMKTDTTGLATASA